MADPCRIRASAAVKGKPGVGLLSWALILMLLSNFWWLVLGLGSMSSIAISYGESGAVFCGLRGDGSHHASCYGSNPSIVHRTPRFPFIGLTAGDGFMCGLLMESQRPYCWGSSGYVQMGVPQPMAEGSLYLEISAGDHHLCGLRHSSSSSSSSSLVDCWGYNMTTTHAFEGRLQSISAGSEFNCGLFSENRTVVCWGDQTSSRVISLIPRDRRFLRISAGGYHVCGIPEGLSSGPFCWGRSLDIEELSEGDANQGGVDSPPSFPMSSIAGAKFHACGIRSSDRRVACWGFRVKNSTPTPVGIRVHELAAGDYFTCGIVAETSLHAVCWGLGFPSTLPLAASPGVCRRIPCPPGSYESNNGSSACRSPETRICLPCSNACPPEMRLKLSCTAKSDRLCEFNCSACSSADCFWNCSSSLEASTTGKRGNWSVQLVVIAAEMVFVVFMVGVVSLTAVFYVRYRLRNCRCSQNRKAHRCVSSPTSGKVRPDGDEHKVRRARKFSYGELERATGGFSEESQVGKGSFSRVFRGVLEDGAVVAVKRAVVSSDLKKNSREFRTELDLLSRLNHAHLLNLLGYCEEGRERLLVYEFMAHGSLHQHLHGKSTALRERLDWVRRVTIAVQAARGIEYLHGYACPPVIHRDIKSSNILIDEEHNARVADFGLSLLGPADSASPLAELPAGTLGYLDPEYYRLHYLTTKSDVYSFGVLLLEILSGRKAIDMRFEEGNIVEWAVPLVRSGDVSAVLDPALAPPPDMEAVRRIANVACRCVRMRGRERPSMDRVTTGLERALAALMGSPCSDQPILPTEVVLGSSRMHQKPSRRTSERSPSEEDAAEDHRFEFRAPSWITFPSVASSSHRRKSSASEEGRGGEGRGGGDVGRGLEEEIEPASPRESMFLQHNF